MGANRMINYDKHDIEDILKGSAKTIKDSMCVITEKYLVAAKAAATIRKVRGWNDLLPLLAARTNLKIEDLVALQSVAAAFNGFEDKAKEAALSIDALGQLSGASEVVRREALDVIGKGHSLDVSELSKIVERHSGNSPAARAEQHRGEYLEALAWSRVQFSVNDLQNSVDQLAYLLHDFVGVFVEWDDGSLDIDTIATPSYEEACVAIRALASEASLRLEALFGDGDDAISSINEQDAKLDATRMTLSQLATVDSKDLSCADFTAIQADLEYLTSEGFAEGSAHVKKDRPKDSLKVLELCAGAGGTSLGLMAAGFDHVLSIDKKRNSLATLKQNWPTWPTKLCTVEALNDKALNKFHDIDLFAVGLPCGPGEPREDAEDLYPEMSRIIRSIKPKSFLLEHDAGQRQVTDHKKRGQNLVRLRKLGYEITEFELDPFDFGIPSSRRRYFVVGIRSEIPGVFVIPAVKQRDKLALKSAAALSDLITLYETPATLPSEVKSIECDTNVTKQKLYDSWAKHWRTVRRPGFLPGTLAKEEEEQPVSWTQAGFLVSKVVDEPPTVSDIDAVDYLPQITFDVLAFAQGFPRGWKFAAKKAGKLDMIQAALPPVVAKMVGLAIRSALTGKSFDLEKEVSEPVVDVSLLGIGTKLRIPLRSSRSFTRTGLHHQITRLLDGEQIGLVEPNRTRRDKILKPLLKETRAAQAKLASGIASPRAGRFS